MSTQMSQRAALSPDRLSKLELLARSGYAARGVIYLIIGGLAVLSAFGPGGETTDSQGALATVLSAPAGWLILLLLAVGLFGYSAWRFCQGLLDPDHHGTDLRGVVVRSGLVVSGIVHLGLAVWASKAAIGYAASSSGSSPSLVEFLMRQPAGQWLVGIAGLLVIGTGMALVIKGHQERFERFMLWDRQTSDRLSPVCRFGLYARGATMMVVGGFIVYAAVTTDPSQAGGLSDALVWLGDQVYGPWLLAAVAAGLFSFGLYSCLEAYYRRVRIPV